MYTVITTKGTKPSNKKRQGQAPGKKEESIMTSIQINHKNNTIEMTKKFYVESCKYGTDEYKTLQEVRRDYPGYLDVSRLYLCCSKDDWKMVCECRGLFRSKCFSADL